MDKLIELLNEYEKEVKKSEFYEWEKGVGGDTNLFRRDTRDEEGSHLYSETADTYAISKKYGFIKRLVENNNIDILQLDNRIALSMSIEFNKVERVLMALSISDTPIEDLISYLK